MTGINRDKYFFVSTYEPYFAVFSKIIFLVVVRVGATGQY